MSEILASVYERIEQTGIRTGILFLDEINCVSETLMPAMLQLLQSKQFGTIGSPKAGSSPLPAIRRRTTSRQEASTRSRWTGFGCLKFRKTTPFGATTRTQRGFTRRSFLIWS